MKKARPVVVTTAHRGIFVGRTTDNGDEETIELKDTRMVVYYSAGTRGVLGIAERGPQKGSRVSPKVPRIALRNITALMEATPEAEKVWEAEPWS